MSSIVTDLSRKERREHNWLLAGSIFSGIGCVGWFLWTKVHTINTWYIDVPVFVILFLIFAYCTWRVDSDASRNGYCPDEPMPKD